MNKNSDVCPYNLTVVIHKAENLAIADITSSDPYVIVSIGKNVFLRTQTIYRNRKNPKWEEKAKIGLLNIYDTLKINVFDENQVSNDKMLGTVSIDMTTIPYNEECEQTLVLVGENGLSTPPCGKIYVSLILQKYNTTVCLQSRSPDHHINKISPEVMSYLQSTLTFHNLQSGPFELSFIRSPFMTLTPSEISEGRITDILLDVKALVTGDNEPTQSYSRRNYSICSSTSIDSSNFRCSPSVPFKKLSILFVKFCTVSNSNMATSNILVFRNKHTLWVWTRWLRVAFAFWQGTLAEEDLPMWVVESSHQISDSTLRLYSDGEKSGKVKGRFTLSLFEPYRINCRDLKSGNVNCFIDLRVVASIRISMDSPVHQRYRIQIDQISTNLSVHDQRFVGMLSDINIILKGTERFDLSRADDSENNNNGRQSMSPRAFTFNCHSIALDVETSKHSESNSSPNPGSEINPTTSDVISTMTDYSGFHVYLCSSDKSVLPDLPLPSVLPDLSSLPTLPNLPSVALASQLKNAISAPTLLAHKYVLYSDILNGPAKEEFTRLNTQIDPLLTNSSTIAMSLKMAPTYNSSLIIKLLAADFDWYNSHHPQSDTLDSSSTSFIVRCSACDWRGKESKAINEIDSPHFSVGKTPNFDNYEFSIPFNTSAWTNVCFVKLKLYLLKGIVVSEFRKKGLGVFLIPFVDFFHQSKTPASTPASSETTSSIRDYDVVLEPMTIPKKVHHQTIQKGTIKVKLGVSNGGNRSTATDITESPTTVDLKFKLHSNLLYQTEWAAEAFLANDQTAKSIELCNVFANFDGLNIKLRNVTQQTSEDVDEDNDDDDDENDNATSTANTTNTGGVSSSSSKSVAETAGPLTPAISSVTEAPMKSSHSHVPSQAQIETQRDNKPNSSFLSLCGCGSSSGTIGSVVSDSFRSPRSEVVQRRRSTVVSERQMLYTAHKDAALSTCQERTNFNSDWVSIQWSQVTSVFEVTDSVLSLNIKVNRYFGEDKSRNAIFRPASVEIFIVNCPSKQLRTFIDERMTFAELRGGIVTRGDASIMNDLNDDAVSLERRGKELKASMSDISGAIPKSTRRDMIRILSRSCRIRAYIATVLYLGMRTYQSVHGVYDNTSVIEKAKVMREWEEDAAQRVKQDLLAVRAIETTNVVSTFTEKIQYLVNAAGAHITEVSMRGWSYREHLGPFERFVEIMANEYLIEITSQISLFFAKNEEFLNLKVHIYMCIS